ncbi:Ig-like domain-containing protein [Inquilinus sp.]|uniref:Ig-like domain-containing protein n=1 Tax=Inquilinus sp. TaxID=1932117 RepID=UPI0031CF2A25
MNACRSALLAVSLISLSLATGHPAAAQTLPLHGPGLGNLTYTDAELFREISTIDWNNGTYQNGIPVVQYTIPGNTSPQKPYGTNVGVMHNGYFVTLFAPDSGEATGGFLIYDVSNPRDIKLVKTIYEPDGRTKEFREPHAFGQATIGGKDYIALPSIYGVEFWDFTDINDIKQVKKLVLPGVNAGDYEDVNWQMWWQAPYLYVASASRGMFIVDARDPANAKLADRGNGRPNPLPVGELGGFRAGPIFAMGNEMVLTSMETTSGFATLDISDPLNPTVIGGKSTFPNYYATCFNGRKLYTSGRNGDGKMAGYDVSNPRQVVIENETTPIEEGLYCAAQDDHLIVGAQRYIFKLDITNPASYPEIGRSERVPDNVTVPPRGNRDPDLGQVAMFGNLVFVGSDHGTNTAFRPHQKAPDTTPPAVLTVSPAAGVLHQAQTSRIGLALSDSILPETVNADTFIVRPKGGAALAGTYSVQLGIVNFSPAEPLQLNTEYEVVLTAGGLKDYAGNGLATEFASSFTTGSQLVPTSYVNRWPLASTLTDVAGSNDGRAGSQDSYADGGLDFTPRTTGVELESDSIAYTLGGTATVSFRMKTSQIGNSNPWQAPGIFGRDQVGGANDVFWGWIDNAGYLNLSVGDRNASNPVTRSAAPVNDGQWHQVAMTRDSATGAQSMVIDGVKVTSTGTPGVMGIFDKLQMLGQIQGNPVAFKGILSDVRVYKRVLTDAEIDGIFNPRPSVLPQQQVAKAVALDPAALGLSGAKYIWNFGDGSAPVTTTAASPIARYTYPTPGNYTVSVTVVTEDGTETSFSFLQSVIYPVTASAPTHSSNIVGNATAVYALDPDAGTVAAIDAATLAKSWQMSVGKEPKTLALGPGGKLWVAVQGDDKLLRIDPLTKAVSTFALDYGSAPYGVTFTPDGSKGLLTLAGKSVLAVFNPSTGAITRRVTLPGGGDVRGIAVSADSKTAYVTRFRSKMNQGEVYKVNLATTAGPTVIALPVDTTTPATEAAAPGVANYMNQVVISPDGRRAILPSKKDNIVQGRYRKQIDLKADTTVRSILSQLDLAQGKEVFAEQIDFNNRAPARAALFAPSGNYIFVAEMESNSVEIVDPYRRAVVGSIAGIGRTPHGLYLDAARKRLFVNAFLDRGVTVHDVSKVLTGEDFVTPAPTAIPTVATEPLPVAVLAGKRVFYNAADPRMSSESYISCASCHVDGDSDGMVWDFTQRGEGLRRTISLQGRQGVGPAMGKLHWTANFDELQDFEKDIRDEFEGAGFMSDADYAATINPLGPKKAGKSADLDNLAAYVTSLSTFPRSPFRTAQGCLTAEAQRGQQVFQAASCTTCHGNAVSQDNQRHDVGTVQPSSGTGSGQPLAGVGFDTPTLTGIWQSSSYFHNGQAATLADVFRPNLSAVHGGRIGVGNIAAVTAYLRSLDGQNACAGVASR